MAGTKAGIYAIVNRLDGHRYIGSSVNVPRRFKKHRRDLRLGAHHSQRLQRACRRDGLQAFDFVILETVDDLTQLLSREQHYLDTVKPEYNMSPTATSVLGIKRSAQTRERLRIARLRRGPVSAATREAIRLANRGVPRSPEAVARTAAWHRGRKRGPMSEETKRKLSEAKRGIPRSKETTEKIVAKLRGRPAWNRGVPHTAETRAKLSAAHTGKIHSLEWRLNCSNALKGRPPGNAGQKRSPEARARMSAAHTPAVEALRYASCAATNAARIAVREARLDDPDLPEEERKRILKARYMRQYLASRKASCQTRRKDDTSTER